MKEAITAWMWSLGVVARSYRIVVALAAFLALWVFSGYELLGLPESSALLLILWVVWAIAQLLAAVAVGGGIVSGGAEAATAGSHCLLLTSLLVRGRRKLLDVLILCLVGYALVWLLGGVFDWINDHSIEVASFLTFHSEKAVSHVPIEKIYNIVEGVVWIILSGFLLSFFIALMRNGWRDALKQAGSLLARCAFRIYFVTSLLSVAVFGGAAYGLMNWHPVVPAGFWDYTQVIVRFSLISILLVAGWLFWLLSLVRLGLPSKTPPDLT